MLDPVEKKEISWLSDGILNAYYMAYIPVVITETATDHADYVHYDCSFVYYI